MKTLKPWLRPKLLLLVLILVLIPALLLTACGGEPGPQGPTLLDRIATLEGKVSILETRDYATDAELSSLRSELLTNISNLRSDLNDLISDFESDLDSLELRVLALEVTDGGETNLSLTVIGTLPSITNEAIPYTITVQVLNTSTSPETGRLVLTLSASSGSSDIIGNITIVGNPTFSLAPIYEPTRSACSKITLFSDFFTLASGQSITYQFTVTVVNQTPDVFWWIPTVQVTD